MDANNLGKVRKDVLHEKRLTEVKIKKIKDKVKSILPKFKNNVEKREEYGEKNTIKIESEDEQIFLGLDTDGEVKQLFTGLSGSFRRAISKRTRSY